MGKVKELQIILYDLLPKGKVRGNNEAQRGPTAEGHEQDAQASPCSPIMSTVSEAAGAPKALRAKMCIVNGIGDHLGEYAYTHTSVINKCTDYIYINQYRPRTPWLGDLAWEILPRPNNRFDLKCIGQKLN